MGKGASAVAGIVWGTSAASKTGYGGRALRLGQTLEVAAWEIAIWGK